MKNRIFSIIISSIIFTGCTSINSSNGYQSSSYRERAKLINYSIDERFIHIEVLSYGCTFITSFELELVDRKNNALQVIRKKPDNCKVKPIKVSLNYAFRHLGLDISRPVKLVNPLISEALAAVE